MPCVVDDHVVWEGDSEDENGRAALRTFGTWIVSWARA